MADSKELSFWKIIERAWRGTLDTFGTTWKAILLGVALAGVSLAIQLYKDGWDAMMAEWGHTFWATVLPIVVVGGAVFVWNLWLAPYWLHQEHAAELCALRAAAGPLTAAPAVRDTKLNEALMYAATGKWGQTSGLDNTEYLARFATCLNEVRQKAFDGKLSLWGKSSQHSRLYVPIPAAYWEYHHVDLLDALLDEVKTEVYHAIANGPIYYGVMASRAEFEREFSAS